MGQQNSVVVSICCLAYNHESYIAHALDGFLIQKTDFKFEILIHDDASNDKTPNIIREYAEKDDRIKAIYQTENKFSQGIKPSKTYLWPRARGKYIALCEGDDYWTDPYKLQKQVDFLEANPEYAICFHPVKILKHDEQQLVDDYITREVPETTDILELAKGNYIHTCSVIFRAEYIKELPNEMMYSPVGDLFLYLLCARFGKVKKLNYCMAVYRIHSGGIWSKTTVFNRYLADLGQHPLFIKSGCFSKETIEIWHSCIPLRLARFLQLEVTSNYEGKRSELLLQYATVAPEILVDAIKIFREEYFRITRFKQKFRKSLIYKVYNYLKKKIR